MSDILADYIELYLATPYTAGDLVLDLYAKNPKYKLTDQKTAALITEFFSVGIDRDDGTKFMGIKVSNVVTNGTFQGATRYTATIATSDGANPMVGLANTYDGTTADANVISDNEVGLKADSSILLTIGSGILRLLQNSFVSASTSEVISLGSGEAFSVREQLSLHTDGKYYKYHATNYPNWKGTAGTAASGVGESFTLRKGGYRVTGYAGLTIGGNVYADNGGTTVQTATATSRYIGIAFSATEIDLVNTAPSDLERSNTAENQAATNDSKYTTPKGVKENITANSGFLGEVRMISLSIAGAITKSAMQSAGWAICDGTSPATQGITGATITTTDDLQDKFIRMSDDETSGTTGGSETDTLPNHLHPVSITSNPGIYAGGTPVGPSSSGGAHDHLVAGNTGNPSSSPTIDTLPPFYEMAFFIKVK